MCKFTGQLTFVYMAQQLPKAKQTHICLLYSLLSNAVLPETNPLLLDEDLDPSVGEDFQKMLNDWENHIGSLQVMI